MGQRRTNFLTRQKSLPISLLWQEDYNDTAAKEDRTTFTSECPADMHMSKIRTSE